jgi:hypothetical protein
VPPQLSRQPDSNTFSGLFKRRRTGRAGESAGRERSVRVFVSSTFRDMHAERDELVKRVFPRLREICEQRRVAWGEVDLRWGITDEQRAEGAVLPVCLAEIEACRPFFIGILGERYGWVPDDIPADLVRQQPWLAEHRERSVTELEIVHGVLRDPAQAGRAFFYLRDPAFLESVPAADRARYVEGPLPFEIERFGAGEAEARAERRRQKLRALKAAIRSSGLPVHDNFRDARALGDAVLRDVTDAIDRLYPANEVPDTLTSEESAQVSFAGERRRIFIGRDAERERLTAHLRASPTPLVVLGETGIGKSALLANWAFEQTERAFDRFGPIGVMTHLLEVLNGTARWSWIEPIVISHFVDASMEGAEWPAMIKRLMREIEQRFGFARPQVSTDIELRAAFLAYLEKAAKASPFVLLIDGIDRLEGRLNAASLDWIPDALPARLHLVVSTADAGAARALERRGWSVMTVEPLADVDRVRVALAHLARYRKDLNDDLFQLIADAPATGNPLFLTTLLDELRLHGEHETLEPRLRAYLESTSIAELYDQMLARYEADYETDRPGLVRDAMSALWAARRGLAERELLDILGAGGERLPGAHWSPFALATRSWFVRHRGQMTFAADAGRRAVQRRYLPDADAERAAHRRLATYFEALPGSDQFAATLPTPAAERDALFLQIGQAFSRLFQYRGNDARKLDEWPWQLARAHDWAALARLFSTPDFLERMYVEREVDLKALWADMERESHIRMTDTYRDVIETPAGRPRGFVSAVSLLLEHGGHLHAALALQDAIIDGARGSAGDELPRALSNKASLLAKLGEVGAATDLYASAEERVRAGGDRRATGMVLANQAVMLFNQGQLDAAWAPNRESETIFRDLSDRGLLAGVLATQAAIARGRGDARHAFAALEEAEQLFRDLGDLAGLATVLGNKGAVLMFEGRSGEALALLKEQEALCRRLGNTESLRTCLNNQALIYADQGDRRRHDELVAEAEQLYAESAEHDRLRRVRQAMRLRDLGRKDEAIALAEEQIAESRRSDDGDGLMKALTIIAEWRFEDGDNSAALEAYLEIERVARALRRPPYLAVALGGQAQIHYMGRDIARALELSREEERIYRDLSDAAGIARSQERQAELSGDHGAVLGKFAAEQARYREAGNLEALARSLANQGWYLTRNDRAREGLPCVEQAYEIARVLPHLEPNVREMLAWVRSRQ